MKNLVSLFAVGAVALALMVFAMPSVTHAQMSSAQVAALCPPAQNGQCLACNQVVNQVARGSAASASSAAAPTPAAANFQAPAPADIAARLAACESQQFAANNSGGGGGASASAAAAPGQAVNVPLNVVAPTQVVGVPVQTVACRGGIRSAIQTRRAQHAATKAARLAANAGIPVALALGNGSGGSAAASAASAN